jgi:hypothetical protein
LFLDLLFLAWYISFRFVILHFASFRLTPCQFPAPTRFKGFTECEKMDFKARLQRVGSLEVLIQVKTPDEGFVIYCQMWKNTVRFFNRIFIF